MYIFPFEIIGTALGAPHVAQANGRFCAGVPASSDGSVKFTPVHELFPDAQSRGSMEIPPPTLDYTVPDSSRSDVGVLTVPLLKAASAISAWESSKFAHEEEVKLRQEAKTLGAPRPLPYTDRTAMLHALD